MSDLPADPAIGKISDRETITPLRVIGHGPAHFLFGPTTAEFADTFLGEVRRAGQCLAFGPGGVDLTVGPESRWDDVAAQFPAGWRPDLIALWLNYTGVPDCLWCAPVPTVGLATDWNLLWHEYRQVLPFCDAILTDEPGVDALARTGIERARPAVLYGVAPNTLDGSNASERDIDVLFVGNLHPAVQRERLPWLARLAKLAERRNVVIRTGISGDECRALMARSRVAFNRSVRSEANMRAFEAAAAGALLFQEAGNRELPGIFAEGRECVYYGDGDLEERLEHFLDHEDERRAIAEAARAKVASYTFSALLMKGTEGAVGDGSRGVVGAGAGAGVGAGSGGESAGLGEGEREGGALSRRHAAMRTHPSQGFRLLGFRPERGNHMPAQGIALGSETQEHPCPERAEHGVQFHEASESLFALSGLSRSMPFRLPRAMPWAVLSLPPSGRRGKTQPIIRACLPPSGRRGKTQPIIRACLPPSAKRRTRR